MAASRALLNSLEFIRENFAKESERNFIMQVLFFTLGGQRADVLRCCFMRWMAQVVCEATQCADVRVVVSAFQCLVRIMSLYYEFMEPYMRHALFPVRSLPLQRCCCLGHLAE